MITTNLIGETVSVANGNRGVVRAVWWSDRTAQLMGLIQRQNNMLEMVDLSRALVTSK
jgi:hypothetical protein